MADTTCPVSPRRLSRRPLAPTRTRSTPPRLPSPPTKRAPSASRSRVQPQSHTARASPASMQHMRRIEPPRTCAHGRTGLLAPHIQTACHAPGQRAECAPRGRRHVAHAQADEESESRRMPPFTPRRKRKEKVKRQTWQKFGKTTGSPHARETCEIPARTLAPPPLPPRPAPGQRPVTLGRGRP